MPELTDTDIELVVSQLARELELDEDDRNVITLRIQRLVWPPSPHPWMHSSEPKISEDGRAGTLSCVGACQRAWHVHQAPNRDATYEALMAAHDEYRTGTVTSQAPPLRLASGTRRIDLDAVLGRSVAVEVTDERVTG